MNIPPRYAIEDDDIDLLRQFTAWIERLVINAAIDYRRRQESRNRECSLEDAPINKLCYEDYLPASKNEFEFAEEKLAEAFSGLNPKRRQILELVFAEGLSAQETADKLNLSIDYVYLQKHRALMKLRDQLMDGGGKCGK